MILSAVSMDLCGELAQALRAPAERISMEMTYRSLYHSAHACQNGETRGMVAWFNDLVQTDLGLVEGIGVEANPLSFP